MSTNELFKMEDLCLSIVLSYLNSNTTDGTVKVDVANFANNVKTHFENKDAHFTRFLLLANELNLFFNSIKILGDGSGKKLKDIDESIKTNPKLSLSGVGNATKFLGDQNVLKEIKALDFTNVFTKKEHKQIIRNLLGTNFESVQKIFDAYSFPDKLEYDNYDTATKKNVEMKDADLFKIFGTVSTKNISPSEVEGGGFRNQMGGAINIIELIKIVAGLPPLPGPSNLYKASSGLYGIVVPQSPKLYEEYTFSILPATTTMGQNNFGQPLYKIVMTNENGMNILKLTLNGNDVPNSLVEFDKLTASELKNLGLNTNKPEVKQGLLSACIPGNKTECLISLNQKLDSDIVALDDNSFNGVNPKLVIDLLEKIKWGWNLSRQPDGSVMRTYVTTFEEYKKIREGENDSVPTLKKETKEYLEKCAKYINNQYVELLNDAEYIRRQSGSVKNSTLAGLKLPIIGFPKSGNEASVLHDINKFAIGPQIVARNNAWARLAAGLYGGNQYVMPAGHNMFNEQSGGNTVLFGGPLYNFYDGSITKLIAALKIANIGIDQTSGQKIDTAKRNFKTANDELYNILAILQQYNRINVHTRDSKSTVSLEDMQRFNKKFESSINALNKSEIKLTKIITQLQESVMDAFRNKIERNEQGV
jgi:hypothetical protein